MRPTEKQLRWWVAGLFVLFLLQLLAMTRCAGPGPAPFERWQFGLFLVVPFVLTILFGLLMRAYWWRTGRGLLGRAEKVMFWLFVLAMSLIWIAIGFKMVSGWR